MLARKVINRGGRNFRGYFPSRKMGQMIPFESLLESDIIRLLEFSSAVRRYRAQPIEIKYLDAAGSWRTAYPDFEATLVSQEVIHVEGKMSSMVATRKMSEKLTQIESHYKTHRKEKFQVITEKVARREPLFSNLNLLSPLRARTGIIFPLTVSSWSTWNEWNAILGHADLLRHISIGNLACDLTQPLGGDLSVTAYKGEADATLLF